jgi:glycosyltransferase involved in cell wall biosynthesis
VVTVVLNETQALEETLRSVLEQTYDNIELIVIDGGSRPPTLDIIRGYADRIDYWQSEPDLGIFDAMNKGIALAGGEWIHFLNCGDRFYRPDTVETVFAGDVQGADFIYGHTEFRGGDFRGVVRAWDFGILWKTMVFTHQSLFSRAAVLKPRGFDLRFRVCADYDMIYNAWAQGRTFHASDVVIASFHPGFSEASRARMAWEKWRVVRRHRHDPAFHLFYLQLFLRRAAHDVRLRLRGRGKRLGGP